MGHIFNDAVTFNGAAAFNGSTSGVTASTANNTELNLIGNPSSATGWSVVNTAGSNPMAVATTVTAGDLPLSGSTANAIKFTSRTVAGAEASEYVAYSFTTPASLSGKMKIEFYMRTGTNFLGGDWTVSLYQSTTRQSLSTDVSGATTLPLANGKYSTTVDLLASTAYTLRFARPTNAGSNAAVLNVANVIVGPGIQPQGAVVGEWQSYTPTGSWSTNTTYTGKYRRVGDTAEINVKVALSGAPTATSLTVNIPTGLTIDSTKLANTSFSFYTNVVGTSAILDVGSSNYAHCQVTVGSTTSVYVTNISSLSNVVDVNATSPITFANGDTITLRFTIPVSEWAGSGTVNLAQNDVQYLANSNTSTTTSDTTSFTYGPAGNSIVAVSSTGVWVKKRIQLASGSWTGTGGTPQVKVSPDGLLWLNASDVFPAIQTSGLFYGIDVQVAGTNTLDVSFGGNGATSTQAWSSFTSYKWRVDVAAAGAAVGFGIADTTSSGLMPSGTYNKSTGAFTFGPPNNSLTHTLNGSNVSIETSGTASAILNLKSTGGNSALSFNNLSNGTPNRFNLNYLQSSDTFNIANANGTTVLFSSNQSGALTLGDTTNAAFPGNNIVGRKDGSTIASGFVGEKVSATVSAYTVTTSETDVTGASISLTAGVWQIFYSVSAEITTSTTINAFTLGSVVLTNSSNTEIGSSYRTFQVKNQVSGTTNVGVASLSASETVSISSTTTYKLRAVRNDGVAGGVFNILSSSVYKSSFFAIRIA